MPTATVTPLACEGGSCQLFGVFGIFVQFMIGMWCVVTLACLWRCETPRRDFCTWLGDMSKQLIGAGWGHFMNIALALIFGKALMSEANNNQCVWYLVGFLSDIFCVTFLCWWATNTLRPYIRQHCGIDIGEYETGPEVASAEDSHEGMQGDAMTKMPPTKAMSWGLMWCCQTGIWLLIMTCVKVTVSICVFLAQEFLYAWLAGAFSFFGLCGHQNAQLVTSVIMVPVLGDAFQFAVQDGFLKRKVKSEDGGYEKCSDNTTFKDFQKELVSPASFEGEPL